jgi:integrase
VESGLDRADLRSLRRAHRSAPAFVSTIFGTHATHLLGAGTNVKVVSERLGHSSVSFTLDVYGHVMSGQQAAAAAAVATLLDA